MTPEVFPAVETQSPLHGRLEQLRELVAADPELHVPAGDALRAELLPRRRAGNGSAVRRFYWSARRTSPEAPWGFTARTLYVDDRSGLCHTYDFPDEPVMDWLTDSEGPLHCHGPAASVQVLRYIPLRRVTLLLRNAPGLPPRVIAKTKRRSGLERAAHALTAAHTAVLYRALQPGAERTFAVPRPVGLDAGRRVLYLEELPGRPLDGELDRMGVETGMRRLGEIHREVHELQVPGLGSRTTRDWLDGVAAAEQLIGVLVPSATRRVEELHARLRHAAPPDDQLAFAQGDFVPSQILCDESGWSVIDLDDGHYADPHAEVAALYTALAWELPRSVGDAHRARGVYLDAYQERAGMRLDPERWRWHLAVAQLRYLSRRLVKGRAAPGEAHVVLDAIDGTSPSAP